jgi:hypothetical protein
MKTKNWDDFLKERFTEEEIKEIKRRKRLYGPAYDLYKDLREGLIDIIEFNRGMIKLKSYKIEVKEPNMKKYTISFYTLEGFEEGDYTYSMEVYQHDIDRIDAILDNDKEHNFVHLDGTIIDINKFAVIDYGEIEEDEE